MKRPLVYAIIALIPLVILWAFALIYDPTRIIPETSTSAPKWVEEGPYGTFGTCNAAITGTPATGQSPTIDSDRAARIGSGVIQTQTDLHTLTGQPIGDFTPLLLTRDFPDNQSHLVWAYGEGRRLKDLEARAEIVYIDAATGEPLLLIKDIVVYDAGFTCPQIDRIDSAHYTKAAKRLLVQTAAVAVTMIYGIAGLVIFIRARRRRVRTIAPVS